MADPYTLHLVSHTHWDREWYEPFQVYRSRLVALVDSLLDILDQEPGFGSFTLDGQAVVLEDYLEIRPQRRAALEDHIRTGRLHVGPWYVLPDEFLVSGESLIRNLIRGRRLASEFGGVMPLGYTPDSFGHVAQLPQILQGFGMETAVLRRGLADEPLELVWEAPSGGRVLLLYLRDGYDNAAQIRYDPNGLLEDLEAARDSLAPHSVSSHLLLLHGTDHMMPQPGLPQALSRVRSRLKDRIVHSSLGDYAAAVRAEVDIESLPVVRGALRNPKRHHLLPGVLSTRMPVKQRNHTCQMLLERRAEPMVAWASLLAQRRGEGTADDRWPRLLQQAWRELLQNHAHDSICGCSIDAVYEDVERRFSASESNAETARSEAAEALVGNINTTPPVRIDGAGLALVVFNPLAQPRTDLVRVTLAGLGTAKQGSTFGVADGIEVLDGEGRRVPVQRDQWASRRSRSAAPEADAATSLLFQAANLPSHGYRTYWLGPGPGQRSEPAAHRRTPSEHAGPELQNDLLRIRADQGTGTLEVFDNDTGATYRGMNRFVDGGDRGDTYNYCPPEQDRSVDGPIEPPQFEIIETGPVRWTLEIRSLYRLPAGLSPDRSARGTKEVEVPITSRVSLVRGLPRVEIETEVDNRARDHRLRVHFPTPFSSQSARVDGPFWVGASPASPGLPTDNWVEQPSPTVPLRSFLWLGNERSRLAVAVRGLPEAEILSEPYGAEAAITLLRCVDWLSRDDLSTRRGHAGPELAVPGAQCLGNHRFHYALLPSSADWREAYRRAQAYLSPLETQPVAPTPGILPADASLLEVHPRSVAVSAVKPPVTGDGLIVRLFNLDGEEVPARLRTGLPFQRAVRVALDEEKILETLPLEGRRTVTLTLGPHEIAAIRLS